MIGSHDIVIYAFLLFCLLVLLKLLLKGDSESSSLQKIFGGLVVLSGALSSQNAWAISVSIFIAGLIIASEDFMRFFAAIIKTSGDRVPETVAAFNLKQTPQEKIIEKTEEEIQEISKLDKVVSEIEEEKEDPIEAKENVELPPDQYEKILPEIEEKVLGKLGVSLNQKIERHTFFSGLDIRFDGGIIDNDNKRLKLFEVKVFPKLPKNKHGKIMIFAIVESIKKTLFEIVPKLDLFLKDTSAKADWKHTLTIAVVLNTDKDFVKIKKKIEILRSYFNSVTDNLKINFVFYNLKNINLDVDEC